MDRRIINVLVDIDLHERSTWGVGDNLRKLEFYPSYWLLEKSIQGLQFPCDDACVEGVFNPIRNRIGKNIKI